MASMDSKYTTPLSSDGGTPLKVVLADMRRQLLPKYGEGETRALLSFIFEQMKGWTAVDLVTRQDDLISDFIRAKIDDVIARLLRDEPVQQIFGCADFYGMKLKVTRDTLIPRPETAELVDIIVKDNQKKDLRVLDCGTGTGCIAIALARNLPFPEVTAIDISDKALEVARGNASTLHASVRFLNADILTLPGKLAGEKFDIVVSNPPYIADKERPTMEANVLQYEPETALFVPDNDPLKFYTAILKACQGEMLTPGGKIYFEINPIYARDLAEEARQMGFTDVSILRDTSGNQRFMTAVKPSSDKY